MKSNFLIWHLIIFLLLWQSKEPFSLVITRNIDIVITRFNTYQIISFSQHKSSLKMIN